MSRALFAVAVAALSLAACAPETGDGTHGAHPAEPEASSESPRDPLPAATTAHSGHPGATAPGASAGSATVAGMAGVDVPPARVQQMGVRVEPVAVRPLERSIRTVGLVAADERRVRKVQTRVSGWVERLFVGFTGESVEAGEPILSIYSPELVSAQREYLLAREASRSASGESDDGSRDHGASLLESARTRLLYWGLREEHIRELERARTPRQTVVLHSPSAGFVTIKPVYAGMYVTPEMELYTVTDLDHVWVWADLYESEIGLVRVGEQARLTVASMPGAPRLAEVSYVNPTIDPSTRTLRVRFDAPNADHALKPGMYATVELAVPLGEVLAVPEDAVIETGERRVVFVEVGEGRFQPREVQLGRRAGRYAEVLSGLSAGERVVVSSQFLLDSESRLRAAAGGPPHAGH